MQTIINANELFKSWQDQQFPSCTQVTLNHGVCDSKCSSCPIGQMNYGDASEKVNELFAINKRQSMSLEIFQRVANEVAQYSHAWLRLHARGEPLLHPNIFEMIAYAKKVGVRTVQCFTDAISLTPKRAKKLLLSGLDVLECSIHGHDKTYERLMRNGKYERVKQNVITFKELRDQLSTTTKLVVSAVDQPELQIEKQAHREFWSQYADQVIYRPYHSWGNRIKIGCSNLPEIRHSCAQLWTRCTIGPTGKILACFNSWDENDAEVLGDLASNAKLTIAEVWQSNVYQIIRQDHANGVYSLPCCKNCKDWGGSSWGDDTYENLLKKKLNL